MSGDFSFLKGNINTIILCSLYGSGENKGDKYGYEIAKEIKERTENKYEIKQPTLYAYLKKLEQQGLIESYWGTESNGGRRRYYRLTPQGRHDCEQFIAEWEYHKSVLNTLVDTTESPIEIRQEDATPLFGERQKRTKKTSDKELAEQDEISRRLDALLGNSEEKEVASETETYEFNVSNDDISDELHDASSDYEVYKTVSATTAIDSEKDDVVTSADTIEILDATDTTVETISDEAATTIEIPASTTIVDYDVTSEEDHKAKFDVKQDNADDFMQNFDERARVIAESRDPKPEANENYQHVLMNVIGDQLDDMQEYKSVQHDGAQKYYTDHPVALEDVADSLAKQGIRMRIYNHASSNYKSKTLMPVSGVLCKSAWLTYAAAIIYFCILIFTSISNNNWRPFVVTISVLALFPIALSIFALYDPSRKEKPIFSVKQYLLGTGIFAAIIVLAALGISIISGIELNNYIAVSSQILLPFGIAILFPLYVVIFYQFYKKY